MSRPMSISARRLAKELKDLNTECPEGIKLIEASDFERWFLGIEVLGETLYQGESFVLKFTFDEQYPISAPAVQFVVDSAHEAPLHPHVYSNGHICASILGEGWSPVLSVSSICITLQSMLASCKKKERPEGNDRYVRFAPENPKKTKFMYDVYNGCLNSPAVPAYHGLIAGTFRYLEVMQQITITRV